MKEEVRGIRRMGRWRGRKSDERGTGRGEAAEGNESYQIPLKRKLPSDIFQRN